MNQPKDLLDVILTPNPPPFALLYRAGETGGSALEVLVGDIATPPRLSDIALPENGHESEHEVLVVVPYRQIIDRGYACVDDHEPLIALTVTNQTVLPLEQAMQRLPNAPVTVTDARFDVDDDAYARSVRKIIDHEIGRGEGANFVIQRSFVADIENYTPHSALAFFRRLVAQESGVYWTFIVHTGTRTFVGATPERHISLKDGKAIMNPISGTYRYPASGPTLPDVLKFLADTKETDELYMVVDEELKMMARICDGGGRVVGPYLKEMAHLAHTEYFIEGHSTLDPREILHETMFAPTVTGSPIESACRVIARYEQAGRGYYSGVVALIGRDEGGDRCLDSSILIRTADIAATGRLRIGVGATLVRHSKPASEVGETRAKIAGLLKALNTDDQEKFADHPNVRAALESRNSTMACFWQANGGRRTSQVRDLIGRRVLVVDAEDKFTSMLDHQLRSLGLEVTVHRFDEQHEFDDFDLVIMGPGPGDPRDLSHPKVARLQRDINTLLAQRRPLLAVCLSHQLLCQQLGLKLVRKEVPNQGLQKTINLFGRSELVGFYNTFAALSSVDQVERNGLGEIIEACRDGESGEVHAVRGSSFASMQFHPESVLTLDGTRIVGAVISELLAREAPQPIRSEEATSAIA